MLFKKGRLFIVTEKLFDSLCTAVVQKKLKLKPDQLRTIIKDLTKALCFLKAKGVIHLDIKPENVLLLNDKGFNVKLADFGTATLINETDYTYLQSRPYRAPEMTFGCSFDFQADMWSFGCLIYELVSSKILFRYKKVEENLVKMLSIEGRCGFDEFKEGKNWEEFIGDDGFVREECGGGVGVIVPDDNWSFEKELTDLGCEKLLKDFIMGCLKINPEERMTAEEAFRHPYCG